MIVRRHHWVLLTLNLTGDLLLRRELEALKEGPIHQSEFEAFDATLRKEYPDNVKQWENEVEEYYRDTNNVCPYMVPSSSVSFRSVKRTKLLTIYCSSYPSPGS